VAVPFVSSVAAAIAVAQAIRIASNQGYHGSVCGPLDDLRGIASNQSTALNQVAVGSVKAGSFER